MCKNALLKECLPDADGLKAGERMAGDGGDVAMLQEPVDQLGADHAPRVHVQVTFAIANEMRRTTLQHRTQYATSVSNPRFR